MIDSEEYLISYSNLKNNLFTYQNDFLGERDIDQFYKNKFFGVPICVPLGIKYFDYSRSNTFKINKKKFAKYIFNTNDLNYVGAKKYFRYGNIFASNVNIKSNYKINLKNYDRKIRLLRNKINNLKNKQLKICAMQIRNIPHFGHEAVFQHIIDNFDYLIINPIFGIKKPNDFNDIIISKSLKFYEKQNPKIKFLPIYSNFHYAGPREALHHMSMRQNIGFNYFYIGRDHAGAQNLYNKFDSINLVKKFKNKFHIKPFFSSGGVYCKYCNKYLIHGVCKHKKLINISGTEFRSHLNEGKIYKHANIKVQNIYFKNIEKL